MPCSRTPIARFPQSKCSLPFVRGMPIGWRDGVNHRGEFGPEALSDLIDLYDYIALRDGPERAIGYIERIEDWCSKLSTFPDRGTRRDDLRPGLRIPGFEGRAVIALQVNPETVTILRILYGGRNIETVFP
jgi:toxin ParE1/3/4